MSYSFTSYGTPDDPVELLDHLEQSFKAVTGFTQLAEYVNDYEEEIGEHYARALRRLAADRLEQAVYAFSDQLELARGTVGRMYDETWRQLNPELATETERAIEALMEEAKTEEEPS